MAKAPGPYVELRKVVEALLAAGVPFSTDGRTLTLKLPTEREQCEACTRKALAAALGVP